MWFWIYCLLVTLYFFHYRDYLFFIRDTAYRNVIWNTENVTSLDMTEIDNYLKENYSTPERIISKVFFVFVSPFFLLYVLFYIANKL